MKAETCYRNDKTKVIGKSFRPPQIFFKTLLRDKEEVETKELDVPVSTHSVRSE